METEQRAANDAAVDELLAEWINRADMPWAADDESTMQKLKGIMERGMAYLRKIAGAPSLSFEGEVKTLLFDFCRYDLNNCREEFEAAFVADLNMLRLSEGFACGKEKDS